SDDDFTASSEKIDVNGNSVETEKIDFHLSEEKIKDIFTAVFDKLAKDEKVKELIEEQMTRQFYGLADESLIDSEELDQKLYDCEDGMVIAKEEVQKVSIPNGLTSMIWIDNKLIVQREFIVELGPSADELVKLTVNGTQLLTDDHITFAYDFNFVDSWDQGTLTLTCDTVAKDDQLTDTIKLEVDDIELAY